MLVCPLASKGTRVNIFELGVAHGDIQFLVTQKGVTAGVVFASEVIATSETAPWEKGSELTQSALWSRVSVALPTVREKPEEGLLLMFPVPYQSPQQVSKVRSLWSLE